MSGRLRTYVAIVVTIGFTLLALLALTVDVARLRANWQLVAVLGASFLVGQFFSIPLSRDPRGPVVLLNAPFAFALVLYGGIGAAALLQGGATLLSGVMHHRPAGRVAFVTADHTIGLAAGAGVWMVLSGGQPVSTSTLPAILVGTAVFVAAKFLLFAVRMRLDPTMPPDVTPGRVLRTAVEVTAMAVAVVLAVVLAAERMALLLAVLLLPSLAAYLFLRSEAKANIGRGEAEQTARREADLRRQEHELRLQQQEVARKLQETDKLKDDLLAMVSHELRNPLATVLGVLRLLSTDAPLSSAERQEMLEMGDRQAQRLRTLIEQLLLAARIERGEGGAPSSGAEPVDADAAELVLQAATEARAGHRDHPIRVECDGGLPVRVAPDAVLQILGSLLDNACKYSPDGRLVRLLALGDGSHAVLAVEDEGAGVPPAERERIFERFTRLDKGRSGLGLGLYIARQLARAQGGDLLLTDARHAAGARFELRLPLRRQAGPPVPSGDDGAPVARTAASPP
jgi:signal transduction histidine kinase